MPWYQQPFFQVALPVILTFGFGFFSQNKRIEDLRDAINARLDIMTNTMNARFDAIDRRLEKIETLLQGHDRDIAALKERTGLVKVK